jgi:hypothetical protein
MFHNPPARGDAQGWFKFEPQEFNGGGNAGGRNSINYNRVVYDKPQPYRSGINNTIYDELGCKSGPGYNDGGGGGEGLFGGAGGSMLLSAMIGSLMRNMNQDSITPVAQPAVATPLVSGTVTPRITPTAIVVPTATPTATPTVSLFPLPQSAPVAQGTPQYVPTTAARTLDSMGKSGDSNGFFPETSKSAYPSDYDVDVRGLEVANKSDTTARDIFPGQSDSLFPN